MRRLSLLLLLLAAALGPTSSAHAALLPTTDPLAPVLTLAGETEEETEEAEESEEAEEEECEPEEGEPCEEEALSKANPQEEQCLLKKASATVTANPGKQRVRLAVHYRTLKPAAVAVKASLRGTKGVLYLGNHHAHFRRSGVYRDTFTLPEKKMKKVLAARDFKVELQVVNTPPSCLVELTAHRDGSRKLLWS